MVSLPEPFVFRVDASDPHPAPYVRVQLSAAIGAALYPHPIWERLVAMWKGFYDVGRLGPERRRLFAELEQSIPVFVATLLAHRPASLRGQSLAEALRDPGRQPEALERLHRSFAARPALMKRVAPTLAFAALGQARLDGQLDPHEEGNLVSALLRHWAWRATVDLNEVCASAHTKHMTARPVAAPRLLPAVRPRPGDLRA